MANKITLDIDKFYSKRAVDLMNKMIIETKENNMKKQEINQRIHNLEEELAELKHLLDQPEGRWRANFGGRYFFIDGDWDVASSSQDGIKIDDLRHSKGNYFQTEEQAKASNIYKILNDPYEYYFAGVSDNWDDVPKDDSAEWYDFGDWESTIGCVYNKNYNYRWKRI